MEWNPCSVVNNRVMIVKQIPTVELLVGRDTAFSIINDFYDDIEDSDLQSK